VRLAHGSLTVDQARAALPLLVAARYRAAARTAGEPPDDIATIATQYQLDETSVRRTIASQADFAARKRAQTVSRVPEQAGRLAAAVGSGPSDLRATAFDRAIEALRDHWWVQVDESGTWRDFDLLSSSGGAMVTSDRTIELDAFPDELRHQVTVRVIAEQWSSGALTERVALEKVLKPTQLVGTPITLRFVASRFPSTFPPPNMSPAQGLRAMALDQHEWMPVLVVGKDSTTQSAVRDTGDVISAAEARHASGGMAGGAIAGLTKRLDDALGPSTPAPDVKPTAATVLTATSIEYEIQRPGERPQRIRRALFDLIGPAARSQEPIAAPQADETAALTRNLALMRETEILPIVCRFVPEYVTHLAAHSLIENREILTSLVAGDTAGDFARARDIANRLAPGPSALYELALARFEWSRFSGEIFVDTLNLLTRHTFFAPSATRFKLLQVTDIVANDIGVDFTADPFAVRLEQGVLDTNAEAVLASDGPDASNPGWVYGGSANWLTLRSPDDPHLRTLGLSEDVRRRIADDLAAGYLVVAPKAPVPIGTAAFSGWWRVEPATGQALGMGSTGMGQEMVEYLVAIAWGMGLGFLFAYMWCQMVSAGDAPVARGCEPANDRRSAFLDLFVRPVYAIGSQCLHEALFAAALGGILGAAAKWGGGGGGSKGGGGKPNPSEPPANPSPKSAPGGRGGGPSPGKGGPSGPENPGPKPSGPAPRDAEWEQLQKRLADATKQWDQNKYGSDAKKYFNEWRQALNDVSKFKDPDHPHWQIPFEPSEVPWPYGPRSSGPVPNPQGGGPLPPTGPGGTQIIPPSTSPTAPTLQGTGPGGTQVISPGPTNATQPQINCAGTPCVSPYAKTQTGVAGVLNTLGQKGGS
jgi:hypothetical protein